MTDGATPEVVIPPATPPVVPPTGETTVTLSATEVEQLRRDSARAAKAQSELDRYKREHGIESGRFARAAVPAPVPPTVEELSQQAASEDRKAERGLVAIALDPSFREVFDKDATLRDLFAKNPLGVLDILAPEALDADDAITLVKEALNARKTPAKAVVTPAPVVPPTPPVVSTPAMGTVDERIAEAKKIPGTQQAIAAMIKIRSGEMKSSKP